MAHVPNTPFDPDAGDPDTPVVEPEPSLPPPPRPPGPDDE